MDCVVPLSVLDLAPITLGATAADALANSVDLARHAEAWGFRRYWVAEHHNMPGVASAATAVVIGYIAGGTKTIRVGAGGVMLPNHSPLVVAEQFGTLESLYPGRIDLGLGRAPGTDQITARALRRHDETDPDAFPSDVVELQSYFTPRNPAAPVRAIPGVGLTVPIWLLGSSLFSAQLAAALGLPFAFASHFAPDLLLQAIAIYRDGFTPSATLAEPYLMACIPVVAAETTAGSQAAVHVPRTADAEPADAAAPGSCRRRSTAWTLSGRRWNAPASSTRFNTPSLAMRQPFARGSRPLSRGRVCTN